MNMACLPYRGTVVGLAALVAGVLPALQSGLQAAPKVPAPTLGAAAPTLTESRPRDRGAFARALALVKKGERREDVQKLLGEPDDVWVGDEARATRWRVVPEEEVLGWAYGGAGHLTFPTLGKVGFDAQGTVVTIWGQGERLPGDSLPPERETRRVLRLLDRIDAYDPLDVIRAVNALQPLGKERALAVVDEYLRVGGAWGLMSTVVRSLFEVPDPPGHLPQLGWGGYGIEYGLSTRLPADPKDSPRFPLVLYRDIPFWGINHYAPIYYPEQELGVFRKSGKLRAKPLRPPDNPLEIVDDLVKSPAWPDWGGNGEWGKAIARLQVLNLVESAYPADTGAFDRYRYGSPIQEALWRAHVNGFSRSGARWDPTLNCYVRGDGTFNGPESAAYTFPRLWKPAVSGGVVRVELHRRDANVVRYSLSQREVRSPTPRVRFHLTSEVLGRPLKSDFVSEGGTLHSGFAAPEGSGIRVVVEHEGKVVAAKVLYP